MLTKVQAEQLVSEKLQEMSSPEDPFVVVPSDTMEESFGWVFFYNSKRFLETGEFSYRLAGNGPVIVNKHDGTIEFFGAHEPVETVIQNYLCRLHDRKS